MSEIRSSIGAAENLRILITGKDGQVGRELTHSLASLGDVTATSRAELDLTSDVSIQRAIRAVRPQLIVNAAAYTSVDKAESEPELAQRINTDAVATLAVEAKAVGAAVIHYSTDYIFDGKKTSPYTEEDAPNPLGVYGRTKLGGEQALRRVGISFLVLRTSWVYGVRGKNFLLTILKLAADKPELRIVVDQTGAPTWSHDIATVTAKIVKQWMAGSSEDGFRGNANTMELLQRKSGIYHMTSAGETTWYGFAEEAIRMRELLSETNGKLARLTPISSAEYSAAAARPKNSQLDCSKLALSFNCRFPDWKDSLEKVLRHLDPSKSRQAELQNSQAEK